MDMDTIIADWKQNAEQHGERNLTFLRGLKRKDDRIVDREAHRLLYDHVVDNPDDAYAIPKEGPSQLVVYALRRVHSDMTDTLSERTDQSND